MIVELDQSRYPYGGLALATTPVPVCSLEADSELEQVLAVTCKGASSDSFALVMGDALAITPQKLPRPTVRGRYGCSFCQNAPSRPAQGLAINHYRIQVAAR